jgi:hypothetical protein
MLSKKEWDEINSGKRPSPYLSTRSEIDLDTPPILRGAGMNGRKSYYQENNQ